MASAATVIAWIFAALLLAGFRVLGRPESAINTLRQRVTGPGITSPT